MRNMKIRRVEPVLAIQRERRERRNIEIEKSMIEKRREQFRKNLSESFKGKHFDERI
jgi:hypothetical protein